MEKSHTNLTIIKVELMYLLTNIGKKKKKLESHCVPIDLQLLQNLYLLYLI